MNATPAETSPPSGRRMRRARGLALAVGTAATILGLVAFVYRPRLAPEPAGRLVYQEDFEGAEPGSDWKQGEPDPGHEAGTWRVVEGRLRAENIHNAALWLQVPLPEKVRIDFDARAETADGDVKCEVFGDGRTHQSGYIVIHGGWRNGVRAIARRDEHAEERREDNRCDVVERRQRCVEPGVDYAWTIIRTGAAVEWYLNGRLLLTYDDPHPIAGRHFAFNNWEAGTSFDNLRIYDLGP